MARNSPGLLSRIAHWFKLHSRNSQDSLRGLLSQPLASFLTIAVIGVALALPAALDLLVKNGRSLAGGWENVRDFSVYMKAGSELADAQALAGDMKALDEIAEVEIISADDAFAEFREASGLGDVLNSIGTNPLPHTLVLRPVESATADALQSVADRLGNRPDVDIVQIDTAWVERLNAILDFLRRIVIMTSVLLVIAAVIIVGNTIRLDIQNQRDEIEVLKLLGASDGFVRRPFLYVGLWYGAGGSLFALLVLMIGGWLLSAPMDRLLGIYAADTTLLGVDMDTAWKILAGGVLAGWGGAWTAVTRHLSAIQPK